MTKISLLNPAIDLNGNEQVVLVKDGVTRRAAVSGLVGAAVAPALEAAENARDQALNSADVANVAALSVDRIFPSIIAGIAGTNSGEYFFTANPANLYLNDAGNPVLQSELATLGRSLGNFITQLIEDGSNFKEALEGIGSMLASPAGASHLRFLQQGADPQTDAETLEALNRRTVWAEQYGFSAAKNGAQNEIAFKKAFDALPPEGGTIRMGPGIFVVNDISVPVGHKGINIQGSGFRSTVLQIGTPEGPLLRRDGSSIGDGRVLGANIGNFSIRAHALSDKTNLQHRAVDFTGFCNSRFHDIAYISNGSGAVGCVFSGDAKNGLTYCDVFERIIITGLIGEELGVAPSRVLRTHNDGGTFLNNPNLIEFRDSWIYANRNLDVVCDIANSTRSRVTNCLFEASPETTAVIMGQACIVEGNWFEVVATNIATDSTASVDGSSSLVIGNYFSGAGTNFIDTINIKPLWIGNSGGGQEVGGQGVTKVMGATADPAAPTLQRTAGSATSTFQLVVAAPTISMDAVGRVTYRLVYSVTPASDGYMEISVALPAGYSLEHWDLGCTRLANGVPVTTALQTDNASKALNFIGLDPHDLIARVTIVRD